MRLLAAIWLGFVLVGLLTMSVIALINVPGAECIAFLVIGTFVVITLWALGEVTKNA